MKNLLLAFAVSIMTVSTTAWSAGCVGYSCDGQDPVQTGCANGAVIAASSISTVTPLRRIRVFLMWSPTCKTNWARIDSYWNAYTWDPNFPSKPILNWVYVKRQTAFPRQETQQLGQGYNYGWTNMVYGDRVCVFASGAGYEQDGNSDWHYVLLTTNLVC